MTITEALNVYGRCLVTLDLIKRDPRTSAAVVTEAQDAVDKAHDALRAIVMSTVDQLEAAKRLM